MIRLRDEVVPILNLRAVDQRVGKTEIDEKRIYVAILTARRHDFVGLMVDRMVNEQEVVVKALDGEISSAAYIAGAAILGDGRVILILDVDTLIQRTLEYAV